MVAPFWTDVDTTRNTGRVFYREVTSTTDPGLMQRVNVIIHNAFPAVRKLSATWAFVATWNNVTYFGGDRYTPTNTFQAVLATNGRHSFAIFNYAQITWTTGTASGGDRSTGLGGTPAQAGFDSGDGENYFAMKESRTDAIVNISSTSSVQTPGRWVFQIDKTKVEKGGCNTEGTLVISPVRGNILGGEEILLSGPCMDPEVHDIKCKFGDVTVEGKHHKDMTAKCITPPLFVMGRADVQLSINGGTDFTHRGFFIPEYNEAFSKVTRTDHTKWRESGPYYIEWTPEQVLDGAQNAETVDIDLLAFGEPKDGAMEKNWYTLAKKVPNNGKFDLGTVAVKFRKTEFIGAVRITRSLPYSNTVSYPNPCQGFEKEHKSICRRPAIWTDIHVLQWHAYNHLATVLQEGKIPSGFLKETFYQIQQLNLFGGTWEDTKRNIHEQSRAINSIWCRNWYQNDKFKYEILPQDLPPCPVTLQQALRDRGRFHADPTCHRGDNNGCNLHPGAFHCVRSNECSGSGAGQQCCYDQQGNLLNVADNHGGGTMDISYYKGCRNPAVVPYISHFYTDLRPHAWCCHSSGDKALCSETYMERRPSHDGRGYQPPRPATGFGDPHVVTLDGLSYTFNGIGEYSLVESTNQTFTCQGRTKQVDGQNGEQGLASVWTALAMRGHNTSRVQVSYSKLWGMEVFVDNDMIDFDEVGNIVPGIEGIEIEKVANESKAYISFEDEQVFVDVQIANGVLNFLLYLPNYLKGNVKGLLGVWNEDPVDDLLPRDGHVLSPNASLEDIHYKFGETWRISETSSLFTYGIGENYASHQNESFEPMFEPPKLENETLQTQMEAVCGESLECMFDFTITGGNAEMAAASKMVMVEYSEAVSETKPVITCGFLATSTIVTKDNLSTLAGTIVTLTCPEGYALIGQSTVKCKDDGTWDSYGDAKCRKASELSMLTTIAIAVGAALGAILLVIFTVGIVCKVRKNKNSNNREPRSSLGHVNQIYETTEDYWK
ncbi:sushi domain-containing protein 2-like [Lingula anatina]|uniref:Sushi domain-containing protein 2-like n=1 Tax=Lingula anatina TaxID=7574 RepID=A0A1S3I7M8_LINAN|nr:sushi domain-containing protein 2-like [Lingula anatina]|eukprot:XP_013393861.1 sushi domain-containing protein 2-like [Lingula anatina]